MTNCERSFGSNDELKLAVDNSDPIKVHPEVNGVSSTRVRVPGTEIFPNPWILFIWVLVIGRFYFDYGLSLDEMGFSTWASIHLKAAGDLW